MKQQHDPLDEFLRSKTRETDFEFKEEYWEKAKKLIAEDRRQKPTINRIILFAGILFFFASVYMIAKVRSDYGTTETVIKQKQELPEHAIAMHEQNMTDEKWVQPVKRSAAIKQVSHSDKTPIQTANTSLPEGKEANTTTTTKKENSHPANVKRIKVKTEANQASVYNVINNTEANLAVARTNKHNKSISAKNPGSGNLAVQSTPPVNTSQPDINSVPGLTTKQEQQTPTTLAMPEAKNEQTLLSFYEVEPMQNRPLFTALAIPAPNKKSPVKYPPSSYRYITLEAGINYYNPAGGFTNTADFHAGLRWHRYLSQRFTLSTGFGYSRLHQHHGARVYNSYSYQFGEKVTSTSIHTFRLDYAELPVNLHYRIKTRHFISAGLQFNYLLQSAELISKTGEPHSGRKDVGHFKAFTPYDIQSNINYVLILPNRLMISTGYYFGLIDITDNNAFKNTRYDRNSGFRLTLGYKIF